MIALDEFVRETLIQVAKGVESAQAELAESKALINPPTAPDSTATAQAVLRTDQRAPAHLVELDLAIAPGEKGVMVVTDAEAPGQGSRIRFSIGVSFPVQEPEQTEPDFELAVEPGSQP